MKLKPLHDWAVLVPGTAEDRTAGGLFIPETAKEKPREGVVEAVGPGAYEEEKRGKKEDSKERKFIPTVVKQGDRVLYESWSAQTYTIGTDERVLVRERNILGLIDRPLQIPATTGVKAETAIIEHPESLPAKKSGQALLRTPAKAPKAKPANKGAKKKAAKKPAAKKTAKKTVAKAGKKSSPKPAKPGKSRAAKAKKSGKKK